MRLILTQDVAGLGGSGDVVDVADGYGRNYLVPRRLAVVATRGAEKQVVAMRRARQVRDVRDLGAARELAGELAALRVSLPGRAGASGRLFGSVTAADIVEAVRSSGGPPLERRRVEIAEPIKSLGTYTVAVRLHPDVLANLTVEVVPAPAKK